jgi:undecaprenyl pyrophosphate phosphatase UppP
MEFWTWLFYISKYYEIIDTLILHANKRPASFLQMYHHAGAIICCWMLSTVQTHLPWIFVVLNSFIHTFMYAYYASTCIGIRPRFKHIITKMQQILQFVVGTFTIVVHVIIGDCFSKRWDVKMFQAVALASNLFYVGILFWLFKKFERRTYKIKKGEAKSE